MENLPRLDILLYAHDGRGLGHASRTIAIGLALRRLFPSLRILFLTGCKVSQQLIGSSTLDWIKLPSYETIVINGRSKGIRGKSNYNDDELGRIRGEQIRQVIRLYRPHIILADHLPQGKHRELLAALEDNAATDTRWILGMRGILGKVPQISDKLGVSIFNKHYSQLLWYGDTKILGTDQIDSIRHQFKTTPVECGYVSRMAEILKSGTNKGSSSSLAGTISIPWLGENSYEFLCHLASALKKIGPDHGEWQLFIEGDHQHSKTIYNLFSSLGFCQVEPPGSRYTSALLRSKMAVIYGGYNSIIDILSLALPALVIIRDMKDGEQQVHLQKLLKSTGDNISVLTEKCSEEKLLSYLKTQIQKKSGNQVEISMNGAETAAHHLASLL